MRLAVLAVLCGLAFGTDPVPGHNANHIFNAIHSSMRQWGSSVHHNGMSFFVASVPRDTQFYHGTSTNEPVTGMEWLAFEPEHALVFARPPRPPRPRTAPAGGHHETVAPRSQSARWAIRESSSPKADDSARAWEPFHGAEGQQPLGPAPSEPDSSLGGYLHTYRTKHSLSLLYIDGMSAAKCEKGTLDATDIVLLGLDVNGIKGWDWERGVALCNLTRDEWGGHIDGFLRMEMGFEIILCDFEKDLTVDRIARTTERGRDKPDPFGADISYYRAVASRFDGVGGNRVSVNYDEFVTAFAYDVDLFRGDALPRLSHLPNETTSRMHRDVTRLVMTHPIPAQDTILTTTNWQAVADMVVDRYSGRLESLLAATSLDRLQGDAEVLLRPYIDYSARNRSSETARCAEQYLPASASFPPAGQAVRSVAETICSTLLDTLDVTDLDSARASIVGLVAYLQWPVWKRCRNCDIDEVCYIPMWPSGRKQDYENPQCQRSIPRQGPGESYWH
ncbi:hypothetical protein AURDEDRAFT_127481 [Auricularia subglabra TFB-10046 SS5]|nr:hypothetical protein AURDEDRAFT_127481 [Auricularia subglabra TFB-10046 SS5]